MGHHPWWHTVFLLLHLPSILSLSPWLGEAEVYTRMLPVVIYRHFLYLKPTSIILFSLLLGEAMMCTGALPVITYRPSCTSNTPANSCSTHGCWGDRIIQWDTAHGSIVACIPKVSSLPPQTTSADACGNLKGSIALDRGGNSPSCL